MKVLQVNAVNALSSTGRIVSELASGLEARGHESRVAYSYGPPPRCGYAIGTKGEKLLHALGSRVFGKQAYFSKRGTRGLVRYIETESPDIVHLHNLHGNYINLEMLLTYLADNDVATVLTLHDCWFFTGKCCYYSSDGCNRWLTGCGSCPRLAKDNRSWFVDATAQMLSDKARLYARIPRLAVIGVSDWITAEAERSILSSARILRRIYNWVDLDIFKPTETMGLREHLGLQGKFVILGVASRWTGAGASADKGLADFIELGNQLRIQELAEVSVGAADSEPLAAQIVLVGALDRKTSLPANIRHVDEIDDMYGLAGYYAAADVFLNLSREETFGKVTAEALACGTPAIAYRSTANPELIGEGCGYVVEPGDLTQVLRYVRKVNERTKTNYASTCREFARRNFAKEDRIDDHIRLYEELHCLRRSR